MQGRRFKMIITSITTKPPLDEYKFERGKDPWHRDAFNGFDEEVRSLFKDGDRKEGWLVLDWCENVLGFIPDGTKYE